MSRTGTLPRASRQDDRRARRCAALLAAAAAWAGAVPYVGRALGLRLDVAAAVEVVDHVVPALAVLAASSAILAGARGGREVVPGGLRWSAVAGATFLAGFWIASTHVPLLDEAARGVSPWDAALLHASAALPVLVAGAGMLLWPIVAPAPRRP